MSDKVVWNEAKVKKLRQLHAKGLSMAKIGEELGVSRNAIAGKLSRLNTPSRSKKARTVKLAKKNPAPPEKKKAKTASGLIANMASSDLPLKLALRKIEWSRSKCSWPIGDPKSTEFSFCGKDVVEGKPYCNDHCFEAYTTTRELNSNRQQEKQQAAAPAKK